MVFSWTKPRFVCFTVRHACTGRQYGCTDRRHGCTERCHVCTDRQTGAAGIRTVYDGRSDSAKCPTDIVIETAGMSIETAAGFSRPAGGLVRWKAVLPSLP